MKNREEIDLPSFKSKQEVKKVDVEQFLECKNGVILDIRTPAEYALGHIENAHSFPLFTNEQRAAVGTTYKKRGKDQAVELGLEYVGEKLHIFVKEAKKFGKSKKFFLYCWRGGMRSGSMAWLLSTAGLDVSILVGGYKAYRQSFLTQIQRGWKFRTLLGPTGAGKTELLYQLESLGEQVLDLEGLAHHKGSAFGGLGQEKQPSTEQFINLIHQKLRSFDSSKVVWVEGESMMIGSCFIPQELYDILLVTPFYMVEMNLEKRAERLTKEYGDQDGEQIVEALEKISKRMGYDAAKEAIESFKNGDVKKAVELALKYYDKGYGLASLKRVGENLGVVDLDACSHKEAAEFLINKGNSKEK